MATVSNNCTTTYLAYVSHVSPQVVVVDERNPQAHAATFDQSEFRATYAFFYFDVFTCMVDGVEVKSERLNVSKTFFVNAQVFSLEDLECSDRYDGPSSYMKEHKLTSMIRNRHGNFETRGFDPEKHQLIEVS